MREKLSDNNNEAADLDLVDDVGQQLLMLSRNGSRLRKVVGLAGIGSLAVVAVALGLVMSALYTEASQKFFFRVIFFSYQLLTDLLYSLLRIKKK